MFRFVPFFALLPQLLTASPTPTLEARQASSAAAVAACAGIQSALGSKVYYSGSSGYSGEQSNYWNAALRANNPACIVRPTSTAEVQEVVNVLKTYPNAYYAVKSGGHDPNPGHSATDGGVLISLFDLAGATLSSDKSVAYVKPGGRWQDVIGSLEPTGYAVTGGRLGIVGVGGYLTGGGLSFLSAQVGLAADTIQNFEVVFANGSVGNVNAKSNKDLFRAMKGSTNQYGIVTQFTMKAIPIGQIWGGSRIYGGDQLSNLYLNFAQFTQNPKDPKAAIILTIEYIAGQLVPLVFYFYDGPSPPAGVFYGFLDQPYITDNTKTRAYSDLLAANAQGAGNITFRTSFSSTTLPLPQGLDGANILSDVITNWTSSDYFKNPLHVATIGSIAFQSFPNLIGKQSEANGGNAMGLKGCDGPRFIVEQSYLYLGGASDDQDIWTASLQLVDKMQNQIVPAYKAKGDTLQSYQPYFANDALYSQPVFQSYSDYKLFKKLQVRNDPDGFISKRAGGFKY